MSDWTEDVDSFPFIGLLILYCYLLQQADCPKLFMLVTWTACTILSAATLRFCNRLISVMFCRTSPGSRMKRFQRLCQKPWRTCYLLWMPRASSSHSGRYAMLLWQVLVHNVGSICRYSANTQIRSLALYLLLLSTLWCIARNYSVGRKWTHSCCIVRSWVLKV